MAAYVRVSTDDEEQLNSFTSQKQYYQEKISQSKEWILVGIYADEGITGTKTKKRDDFLRMINDCMNGKIDIILTKSISRFSRNLVDTIQYVRMLKSKGVTVIFEKENINTSTMESEMQLALLSTLAQNHKEDKSITVNEEEAETVRLIFDLYLSGMGGISIAKELKRQCRLNKKGVCKWTDSGVIGIIKNEKYKGDLLLGKTYTVDPISKRRLENRGEEDKFYIENHHEPIVSREVWDRAQEIRKGRYRSAVNNDPVIRIRNNKMYALSSMCECGFCGEIYTRRIHHQSRSTLKPVWKCSNQIRNGIAACEHSRAIDESIIENSFLEMMSLMADNFDDVLDNLLATIEESLNSDDCVNKLKRIDKSLAKQEDKRNKLTDMMLDDKINEEAYNKKYEELSYNISKLKNEKRMLTDNNLNQKTIKNRMCEIRNNIKDAKVFDEFDRVVFESIVKKVIVGTVLDDGTIEPYKLTFVLKGMSDVEVTCK